MNSCLKCGSPTKTKFCSRSSLHPITIELVLNAVLNINVLIVENQSMQKDQGVENIIYSGYNLEK
jgi:hypothetical protein